MLMTLLVLSSISAAKHLLKKSIFWRTLLCRISGFAVPTRTSTVSKKVLMYVSLLQSERSVLRSAHSDWNAWISGRGAVFLSMSVLLPTSLSAALATDTTLSSMRCCCAWVVSQLIFLRAATSSGVAL